MSDTKKLFAWLRSLWGALAATVVAFPSAAILLKVPLAVQRSQVSAFYPILGSLAAAVAVLVVAALASIFQSRRIALAAAVFSAALAFASIFGFLYVRMSYLDREFTATETDGHAVFGDYSRTDKSRGLVEIAEFKKGETVPWKVVQYGDPMDLVALGLFSLAFGSFAAVFSVLGVHLRETKEA